MAKETANHIQISWLTVSKMKMGRICLQTRTKMEIMDSSQSMSLKSGKLNSLTDCDKRKTEREITASLYCFN
jgi:hypothetical protein